MWSPRPIQISSRAWFNCAAGIATFLLIASVGEAQTTPAPKESASASSQDDPDSAHLLATIGKLNEKFFRTVKLPAPRSESHLLPLLPESTVGFAAIANYGDVAHQAVAFLEEERKEDAEVQVLWNRAEMVTLGPKIEDGLEEFYQFSQFLGDEVVFSASMESKEPSFYAVAEVHKPGLKKYLSDLIDHYGGATAAGVRLLEPAELATAKQQTGKSDLLVLIRPDFIFASEDAETLRSLSARFDKKGPGILSTPFGKRTAKEYLGGLTFLVAADLQTILSKSPTKVKNDEDFQKSGFADVKYLIWEHKEVGAKTISQSELSFTRPRRGSAAWLTKPGPLPSLDFVSPNAVIAGAFKLTSPEQIFEEIQGMFPPGPSSPFASLPQAEKGLGMNHNDDLLALLGGELGFELDSFNLQDPAWKMMASVTDAAHLQKTFTTLLALAQIKSEQSEEDGVKYYTIQIPSTPKPYEFDYAFLDGYLVAAANRAAVAEAAKLHRSGNSLAKSAKFRAAFPPGHSSDASALFYDNPVALAAFQMQRLAPALVDGLTQSKNDAEGAMLCLYGEESAISEASNSGTLDVGAMLVVAAIAIPNLLKSRLAANEASAVGSLRTITVAQVTYASTYPNKGYAPNLSNLGPNPKGSDSGSPEHANLIDASLGGPTCKGDVWCTKSGYQFHVSAVCKEGNCSRFIAVAKPESATTGTRNFCEADDGVIHYKMGEPLTTRPTIAECRKWEALQ